MKLFHLLRSQSTFGWAEIKPLIRELVCPVFVEMGFEQAGVTMWRYREGFVDVVRFRVPWRFRWQVEFGCTTRKPGVGQPLPWDCEFRYLPIDSLQEFARNEAAQRLILARLAPQLRDAATSWFGQFATTPGTSMDMPTTPNGTTVS